MNILLLNDSMKVGGTQFYMLQLAEVLHSRGHDVAIAANDGEFVARIPSNIAYYKIMLEGKNPLRLARSFSALTSLIKENAYDVIHVNAPLPTVIVHWALIRSGLDIPVVTTTHKIWEKEAHLRTRIFAAIIYPILNYCSDQIITVNRISYDKLCNLRPRRTQIELIYHGVKAPNYPPNYEKKKNPEDYRATPQIISIGRLVKQKRFDLLLNALEHIRKEIAFKCLIIGEGPLRSNLETLSRKLQLDDIVQFCGYRENVSEILEDSDLVAVTSSWELTSFAMLEALQHRLPMVGFDSPGVRDVIEHDTNGYLVPFGNTKDLAQAMKRVLTDHKLRLRLQNGAGKILEKRFLLDNMVDKTLSVYQRAVEIRKHKAVAS